jgi:hypothetical protein
LGPNFEQYLIENLLQYSQYSISDLVPNWEQYLIEDFVQ